MAALDDDKTKVLLDDLFKFVHRVSNYVDNRNAAEIAVLPAVAELLLDVAGDEWIQKVVHNAEPSIKAKADARHPMIDEDDGKFIHHEILLL